jgi:hypothetical protein
VTVAALEQDVIGREPVADEDVELRRERTKHPQLYARHVAVQPGAP